MQSMTKAGAAGPRVSSADAAHATARDAHALNGLLMRTALGDQAAFRLLYDGTSGRLFAICLRIVQDRGVAEDVLQEAYVRIWERARQFDPARGSALGWIIGIARNYAIDVIRSRGREAIPQEMDLEAPDLAAQGGIEATADLGTVGRCLAGLEEGPRRAIVLAYRYGLSHEELATALNVPLGTVKTWVSRGLARLRMRLDAHR
jgi:RNA polymerase sigma-70 factor (ECF subfamily)